MPAALPIPGWGSLVLVALVALWVQLTHVNLDIRPLNVALEWAELEGQYAPNTHLRSAYVTLASKIIGFFNVHDVVRR